VDLYVPFARMAQDGHEPDEQSDANTLLKIVGTLSSESRMCPAKLTSLDTLPSGAVVRKEKRKSCII